MNIPDRNACFFTTFHVSSCVEPQGALQLSYDEQVRSGLPSLNGLSQYVGHLRTLSAGMSYFPRVASAEVVSLPMNSLPGNRCGNPSNFSWA